MNPQADQTPGLRLPQPSFNVDQASSAMPRAPQNPAANTAPQQVASQAVPGPAIQPMPSTPAAANAAPSQVPQVQDMPTVQSDDENAIDQEWTNKAREIVEKNRTDPYLLSKEISKVKSQYIKIRYNKDIKTVED